LIVRVLNLSELHDAASAARGYFESLAGSWYVWNGWP